MRLLRALASKYFIYYKSKKLMNTLFLLTDTFVVIIRLYNIAILIYENLVDMNESTIRNFFTIVN